MIKHSHNTECLASMQCMPSCTVPKVAAIFETSANISPTCHHMTPDVIRRHIPNYFLPDKTGLILQNQIRQWRKTSFIGPPHAVNVAQQSDEGGFSVQANRASCVLVRQKVFCPTEPTCPTRGRENPLQSRGFPKRKKGTNPKSHVHGENNRNKNRQKTQA